jgi:hypothetical protein
LGNGGDALAAKDERPKESPLDTSCGTKIIPEEIVTEGFDKAKLNGKIDGDGWVLLNDMVCRIKENHPGLLGGLGDSPRKLLEVYAKATGKIEIDASDPKNCRVRWISQNNSGGQVGKYDKLDEAVECGFQYAKPGKDGWICIAGFWALIKQHCPFFKDTPGWWRLYGKAPQAVLAAYEKETGKIELDKPPKGSWRIRRKQTR